MTPLTFPVDEVTGAKPNWDCAADFLELAAFFHAESRALISELANQSEIGADDDPDLDDEMKFGAEQLISATVSRIESRRDSLGASAYPYELDPGADILICRLEHDSLGHAAYVLSLVLSNLKSLSPILVGSPLHPNAAEERTIRQHFQYFATSALASEIHGSAWSFGFPRPDGSGFLDKLKQIWDVLRDGSVDPQPGAPGQPKDDQVDVFAARPHRDGLPGFLFAAAQVATGRNAREKSLRGHIDAFKRRWFATQPVTDFVPYMIVPFAIEEDTFFDDVSYMGNILHRLRVPRRVAEASSLVDAGHTVEAYGCLEAASEWVAEYQNRARALA